MTNKNIVLFVYTYPYIMKGNAEATVLNALLPVLCQVFRKVIIVPTCTGCYKGDLPPNIHIEESLSKTISKRLLRDFYGIFSFDVIHEFKTRLPCKRSLSLIKELIIYWGNSKIVEKWCYKHLKKMQLSPVETILYSFWFDGKTLGASKFGKSQGYRVVTSAHGNDLFEFRHPHLAIPFRHYAMHLVDEVYPDSHYGTEYLASRYPMFKNKIKTFLIGTLEPGFRCSCSLDSTLRILSVSRIDPVKGLELILDAVIIFATRFSDKKIEWNHIGEGQELEKLRKLAQSQCPVNANTRFHGQLSDSELRNFLKTASVDAFVNCSSSEGTSVAIMEAMSLGIPIIVTPVGGNVELVSGNNGILLPEVSTAKDLAAAFELFINNSDSVLEFRINSRAYWEKNYNAVVNYKLFSEYLSKSLNQTGGL